MAAALAVFAVATAMVNSSLSAQPVAPPAQSAAAPETEEAGEGLPACDFYGSDAADPARRRTARGDRVPGTAVEDLDVALFLGDCGGPARARDLTQPEERTHTYIRARALLFSGRMDEAMREFHLLCDVDYGAACYQLALAERVGKGGEPIDPKLSRRNMAKAARLYVTVAGNELLQEADWVELTEMPGFHRALSEGRLRDIPHTVSTQRVAITLYSRLLKQSQMFEQSIFTVDDEFNKNKLIAHIVTERVRTMPGYLPPLFKVSPGAAGQNAVERFVGNALASGAAVAALGQRVMAFEVGPAAADTQTLITAFNGQVTSQERNDYMRNLQKLMAMWVDEAPLADSDSVCALFRQDLRQNCLPMADYNPGDPVGEILTKVVRH